MKTIEILIAIAAVWGAALSTIIFFRDKKKQARIARIYAYIGFVSGEPDSGKPMIVFHISNPGYKPITIDGPLLILPDNQTMAFPGIKCPFYFPHSIEEGKAVMAWYRYDKLKNDLLGAGYNGSIKVKAAVYDQTRKMFKDSNFTTIDLDSGRLQ